jgi:hypothetical protein
MIATAAKAIELRVSSNTLMMLILSLRLEMGIMKLIL